MITFNVRYPDVPHPDYEVIQDGIKWGVIELYNSKYHYTDWCNDYWSAQDFRLIADKIDELNGVKK